MLPLCACIALVAAIGAASGITGLFYACLYAAAISPGVELGRRAAGPAHPAGWIIGALLGYGTTQLALWLPIYLGIPHVATFIVSWILQAVVLVTLSQRLHGPVLTLPAWSPADTRALALTLLLVPLLMGPPYRNLGRQDDTGARHYRAYFTADFVWHTALAVELRRIDSPPRNPYMASRDMHYYWTYFLLPALAEPETTSQIVLKANAMLSAPLLIAMLYLLARTAVPRAGPAAAAVALGVLATSAEGSYELARMWESGAGPRTSRKPTSMQSRPGASSGCGSTASPAGSGTTRSIRSHARSRSSPARLPPPPVPPRRGRRSGWRAARSVSPRRSIPSLAGCSALIYGIAVALDALPRPGALAHRGGSHAGRRAGADRARMVRDQRGRGQRRRRRAVRLAGRPGREQHAKGTADFHRSGPASGARGTLALARAASTADAGGRHRGRDFAAADAHVTLSEPSWVGFRTGQILQLMMPVLLARLLWALAQRGRALASAVGRDRADRRLSRRRPSTSTTPRTSAIARWALASTGPLPITPAQQARVCVAAEVRPRRCGRADGADAAGPRALEPDPDLRAAAHERRPAYFAAADARVSAAIAGDSADSIAPPIHARRGRSRATVASSISTSIRRIAPPIRKAWRSLIPARRTSSASITGEGSLSIE